MNGVLVCIIGPAGAGKHSVIDGARLALAQDGRFVFPRRFITRPPHPGGENHVPVSPERFLSLREAGAFCLDWQSMGLAYGLPAAAEDAVNNGAIAVVKMSANALLAARQRFARVLVVEITAAPGVLARRIAGMGHEMRTRLDQPHEKPPAITPHAVITHDGMQFKAVESLTALLLRLANS